MEVYPLAKVRSLTVRRALYNFRTLSQKSGTGQALSRSHLELQSWHSDARIVQSRNPEGGCGYQNRLPIRYSDRRGDYGRDRRHVRRRCGGADHHGRIGCGLTKSRLLHRAVKR